MLPPLVLNLVLGLHPNPWTARTPGGGDGNRAWWRAAEHSSTQAHGCTCLHVSLTPNTPMQAATPTHTLPFKQPGLPPGQSTAPLQPFTHAHTPLPPPTLARTPELELLQSQPVAGPQRPLQRCVFPAESHSLYRILWELVSDAAALHIIYLFPLPPAQTLLSGELQSKRRQAGSYRDTGGRGRKEDFSEAPTRYIKLIKSPSGHEHQAGDQKGGRRLQQEGTGGRASGPSPPEPAAPAQTGHPVPAQGLR